MKRTIWQRLKKPIIALAPMSDVTDAAFRRVVAKCGKPDLMFTEFVSADGLCSEKGRPKLLRELYFTQKERPIIAQIFGANPGHIREAVKIIKKLGFDGVDINMGCPQKKIEKAGAGAALIKNPSLAQEIIVAAKQGSGILPVSVKTRIGYASASELESWVGCLLQAKPAAITFHLRTRREMSKVPAQWDLIKIPVAMARGSGVLILGNGDVLSVEEAKEKVAQYGVDGVMIGRAALGKPWIFSSGGSDPVAGPDPQRKQLKVMLEHAKLFEKLFCEGATNQRLFHGHTKSIAIMKKHIHAYVSGFPGAAELRAKLMRAHDAKGVENTLKVWYNER